MVGIKSIQPQPTPKTLQTTQTTTTKETIKTTKTQGPHLNQSQATLQLHPTSTTTQETSIKTPKTQGPHLNQAKLRSNSSTTQETRGGNQSPLTLGIERKKKAKKKGQKTQSPEKASAQPQPSEAERDPCWGAVSYQCINIRSPGRRELYALGIG
ncbi:hypothetical protein KM043_003555 [Ampulex compressa]|nr:hypothetical protein KM043_003555 [Ampulex compressa]